MGNSVRMTKNHIYGNTAGIASDTLSAPGHPGFPADGMQIDHNYIYSNNLNLYGDDPPVMPLVPMPIGTGIIWPGMNSGKVYDNWIFDNWRHGTLLAAVPDEVAGTPEGNVDPERPLHQHAASSTSCGNQYYEQQDGPGPAGLPAGRRRSTSSATERQPQDAKSLPNGVDFWWDEFPGNDGNCWFDNTGPDGKRGQRDRARDRRSRRASLPSDCENSGGHGRRGQGRRARWTASPGTSSRATARTRCATGSGCRRGRAARPRGASACLGAHDRSSSLATPDGGRAASQASTGIASGTAFTRRHG